MYILGISCYYHDSAACLLKDGKIVAAGAEERFTRKKHDNSFPINAITYCLDYARIAINEVDEVVFYEKPILKYDRVLNQYLDTFPKCYTTCKETISQWFDQKLQIGRKLKEELFYQKPILYVGHHLSHAASTYYLSGYNKSVILSLDGVGEWATTTIGTGDNGTIIIDKEIQFPHSLGLLYSTLTTYLGFSANDAEYKVMGLAAYGDSKPFSKHFDQLITQFSDGSYQLNMEFFTFDWSNQLMYAPKLIELFGYPARSPESAVFGYHKNIAAALQWKLEEVVLKMINIAYEEYAIPNICLAGGVALNSVLNGKILSKTKFENMYIPPDPSDAGGAMGAAMYVYSQKTNKPVNFKSFKPYLGPAFSWFQIKRVLDDKNIKYSFYQSREDLITYIAKKIQKQKIIGWFQGRMEWGPRALGNRSILASAATTKMRDIINEKVKHREMFRPFAPVILEECIDDYFFADTKLPMSARYMLMVYPFKPKGRTDVPAVVHIDGSGRLQTLVREDNPLYYELIKKYFELTGVPIIINTSFNVRGEPIVCSPEDAVNCFLKTDIDYLVIDQYVCRKS